MIPGDTAKVKAKWREKLRNALRDFTRADADLRRFETEDLPAFETWKHRRLGSDLTDLQLLSREYDLLRNRLMIAYAESQRTGLPLHEALRQWDLREEIARKRREADPEGYAREQREHARDEAHEEPFDDEIGVDLDDLFGIDEFDELDDEEAGPFPRNPPVAAKAPTRDAVRDRYRHLCRLLHPDSAGELTGERRQLWDQVQEAYAYGDLARLDSLLARAEGRAVESGTWMPDTAGALEAMTRHYRSAISSLRQVLRDAKTHPAWAFMRRDAAAQAWLEKRLRGDVRSQIAFRRRQIADIRDELSPPAAARRGGRRRSPPEDLTPEFSF